MEVTRILLVTDKGVRNAGLTGNAEKALIDGGCELTVFEDVEADPPSHVIERAVGLCRDSGIGLVASIGGGSALDTAKLVAYLAKTPDRLDDIYGVGLAKGGTAAASAGADDCRNRFGGDPDRHRDDTHHRKKGVVSPRLLPDWAILDPELTLGLPAHVTAATGIDAMVHAIEAYTSRHKKNPMSDQVARHALALLSANVRIVLHRWIEPRSAISNAAWFHAGRYGICQFAGRRRPCACISNRCNFSRSARFIERACPDPSTPVSTCPRPKRCMPN